MPPDTIKVDRATPWGNPFVQGVHGTREECVAQCAQLLRANKLPIFDQAGSDEDGTFRAYRTFALAHIEELKGRNLACWCPLDSPCHADTLLLLANERRASVRAGKSGVRTEKSLTTGKASKTTKRISRAKQK